MTLLLEALVAGFTKAYAPGSSNEAGDMEIIDAWKRCEMRSRGTGGNRMHMNMPSLERSLGGLK